MNASAVNFPRACGNRVVERAFVHVGQNHHDPTVAGRGRRGSRIGRVADRGNRARGCPRAGHRPPNAGHSVVVALVARGRKRLSTSWWFCRAKPSCFILFMHDCAGPLRGLAQPPKKSPPSARQRSQSPQQVHQLKPCPVRRVDIKTSRNNKNEIRPAPVPEWGCRPLPTQLSENGIATIANQSHAVSLVRLLPIL